MCNRYTLCHNEFKWVDVNCCFSTNLICGISKQSWIILLFLIGTPGRGFAGKKSHSPTRGGG